MKILKWIAGLLLSFICAGYKAAAKDTYPDLSQSSIVYEDRMNPMADFVLAEGEELVAASEEDSEYIRGGKDGAHLTSFPYY